MLHSSLWIFATHFDFGAFFAAQDGMDDSVSVIGVWIFIGNIRMYRLQP
jgi:hypothetical protein